MSIDLDKIRAARLEASGKGPVVVFCKQSFQLPAEMPFEVAEYAAQLTEEGVSDADSVSAILGCFRVLFGKDYEKFIALKPSFPDIEALFKAVVEDYGMAPGESPASES